MKITLKFAKEYDQFAYTEMSDKSLIFEEEGCVVIKTASNMSVCSIFGTQITRFGNLYHWRVKVIEGNGKDLDMNIGVIDASQCVKSLQKKWAWFLKDYGYSYWSKDGKFYQESTSIFGKIYGESYAANDIIDVWLDLRDGINELSFSKNNKNFGKAVNVKDSVDYSLAITMRGDQKKIELVSFEMIQNRANHGLTNT